MDGLVVPSAEARAYPPPPPAPPAPRPPPPLHTTPRTGRYGAGESRYCM